MNRRIARPELLAVVVLLGAGLLAAAVLRMGRSSPADVVLAAPNQFSGPVVGGCYLQTPVQCNIHIDQWQPITTNQGEQLLGFRLVALRDGARESSLLHDFRTDVSNPPIGVYQPSNVRQDYAAECSVTYQMALLVQDTSVEAYVQTGQTNQFTCPAAATPTPTLTPSPTVTSTPSPAPSSTPTVTPTAEGTATATTIPPVLDHLILLPMIVRD